jgi:peroxiredoxin
MRSDWVRACVLILGLSGAPSLAGGLALGDDPPQGLGSLLAVDGRRVTVQSYQGDGGALVIFTDNSCPAAKEWQRAIVELADRFRKHSISVVLIDPNDPQASPADGPMSLQQQAVNLGLEFPWLVDEGGRVARAFGATHTPEAFLFSGTGKLVYRGAVGDAPEPTQATRRYLEDALAALVDGRAIEFPETAAVGCEIRSAP